MFFLCFWELFFARITQKKRKTLAYIKNKAYICIRNHIVLRLENSTLSFLGVKSGFQWRAAPSGMFLHGRLQRKSTAPNPVYGSFLNNNNVIFRIKKQQRFFLCCFFMPFFWVNSDTFSFDFLRPINPRRTNQHILFSHFEDENAFFFFFVKAERSAEMRFVGVN